MDDIIHLLPDSVANQIAAGEVVQRPSSIVKEMVENSIDAGANVIQVRVVDGGKTNVQIIDNGKGMSETDARLSFERHATSKIKSASDLFNLSTMGFRGEALASIAAVAQVELKTRREEDELGTYIQIAGSKVEAQEPIACPVGSNFSVKNLFFNVPARRKFLKGNQTELLSVVADFKKIALVYPDIDFTLYNNDVEMMRLPKASLKQRILDVFGKKMNGELLPVSVETSLATITGYVAKPESSKKKDAHQYFFVNGRYMRHPYFHSAVMKAYENIIPAGDKISYFIYFSVDSSTIDVNVHPTKTEIKFDNEQPIWQVLSATVRETIGKFSNVPLIDFDVEGRPDIPAMGGSSYLPSQPRKVMSDYNPFKSGTNQYHSSDGWEKLYSSSSSNVGFDQEEFLPSGIDLQTPADADRGESNSSADGYMPSAMSSGDTGSFEQSTLWDGLSQSSINAPEQLFDLSVPKFQYKGKYIVFPSTQGIVMVDQYRAHVRILFERNMQSMVSRRQPTQKLLFSEIIQFERAESVVFDGLMEEMSNLGFELSNLGGGSYCLTGVPSGIEGVNVDELLHEMVSAAVACVGNVRQETLESLSLTMAKKAAVTQGVVLSVAEMDRLLNDLFSLPLSARTPDGKIIYSVVDAKTVDSMF